MEPRNPNYRHSVALLFEKANFIQELGIRLLSVGPGTCETEMVASPRHWQQDGFFHAGVQATIADHTSGAAGCSLIAEDQIVLSAEFKINLLRPAIGDKLRCQAKVLKAGGTLIVSESEVFAVAGETSKMVAKATVTLAVIPRPRP